MPSGDQVLVVTGAGRGIGAAVARLAGARGYAVAVNYVRDERAAVEVVRRIEAADGRARAIRGDVSNEADVVALFAEAARVLGPVTALVNNAGVSSRPGRLDGLAAGDLSRVLGTNVAGTILCAREAVRRMSPRHGGGGGAPRRTGRVGALRRLQRRGRYFHDRAGARGRGGRHSRERGPPRTDSDRHSHDRRRSGPSGAPRSHHPDGAGGNGRRSR